MMRKMMIVAGGCLLLAACGGSSKTVSLDLVDAAEVGGDAAGGEVDAAVAEVPEEIPSDVCVSDCGAVDVCGDGVCGEKEGCDLCPEDCGVCPPVCGNGVCEEGEECDECIEDCDVCPSVCGDGDCTDDETCEDCPEDCEDCPPECGDGNCDADDGETCGDCPEDCDVCPPECGDGECNGDETCESCEQDCADTCPDPCGDDVCDSANGESCFTCEADCDPCCGDAICEVDVGDDCATCPEDCGVCAACGNEICEPELGETCNACQDDCGICCPNGVCEAPYGETCLTCLDDCGLCDKCGDGNCDAEDGETCVECPGDCGECPAECGDGIVQDGTAEECDDGNKMPLDGCDPACMVEPAPADPGAVVISEMLIDPEKAADAAGEWIELYNTTDEDIDINAWVLSDNANDWHRIFVAGGVVVPAQGYVVLARNGDPAVNGGVNADYVYTGMNLTNTGDQVILMSGETAVDVVQYKSDTHPYSSGVAMSLDPLKLDQGENDLAESWCLAQTAFGAGDLGTPDAANPACPLPAACPDAICQDTENCNDCPQDCGACCPNGVCDTEFGENCAVCPLDCGGVCCGNSLCEPKWGETCDNCVADCGACCPNGVCDDLFEETCAVCPADCGSCCGNGICEPAFNETCKSCSKDCNPCCGNGVCEAAYGEACSTCAKDCGACPAECGNGKIESGETCDDGNKKDNDGCSAACLIEFSGVEPGVIVITEIMKNPKLVSDTDGEWFELTNVSSSPVDIAGWTIKDDGTDKQTIDPAVPLVIQPGKSVVLGNNKDPLKNGGVTEAYQYIGTAFTLGNGDDEIILVSPENVVIDQVAYADPSAETPGFPDTAGKSMALDPSHYNATDNDQYGFWCDEAALLGGGDFGSPGSVNTSCAITAECGNGKVEVGEQCDDGNLLDCDGCSPECQLEVPPVCGNGVLDSCEECDDGNVVEADGCSPSCTIEVPAVCGNGFKEPGEDCDDGNLISLDGCSSECKAEGVCGNGIKEPGEACDDGNNLDGDTCGANCDLPNADPLCGNGIVEGTEMCDDKCLMGVPLICEKVVDDGDGCSWECLKEGVVPNVCGNGVVEPINDESCDDGNTIPGDGCNQWCKKEGTGLCEPMPCCGDGYIDAAKGEECDDGNLDNNDGCSSSCKYEISPTTVSGTVTFSGAPANGDNVMVLAYAKLQPNPLAPADKPVFVYHAKAAYPHSYSLGVAAGSYYILAVHDTGGDALTAGFNDQDAYSWYPNNQAPVQLTLKANEKKEGIDMLVSPVPMGAVSGKVTYTGAVAPEDSLRVLVSKSAPPQVEIAAQAKIKPVTFPAEYLVSSVLPGQYYLIATLDKGDNNPNAPGAEDKTTAYPNIGGPTKVTVTGGQTTQGIDMKL